MFAPDNIVAYRCKEAYQEELNKYVRCGELSVLEQVKKYAEILGVSDNELKQHIYVAELECDDEFWGEFDADR